MIMAGHLTGVRLIEQSSKDVHLRQRHLLAHKICLVPIFHIREYRAKAHVNQTNGDDLRETEIHRFIILSVTNYSVQMEK